MPFAKGSKIVCNPCWFVEDSYVCTNAKNFAYEHEETERHKTAMPIWGKKFPDITDRKQLFVLITKEEHMRRVAENEEKLKLKIAKNEERVRKSPKKGKFSGTEGEQPDLLELFKGHFLTDQDVVSKAKKNESLPEKIDINHPSFSALMSATNGFRSGVSESAQRYLFLSHGILSFLVCLGGHIWIKRPKGGFKMIFLAQARKKESVTIFFCRSVFKQSQINKKV